MRIDRLLHKKKRRVIGLMSGTSANGIDACIVEIEREKIWLKIKQLGFKTFEFPNSLRRKILKISDPLYQNLDEVIHLDFLLGEYFANAAKEITESCGLGMKDIDLIGSHGQTVRHLPLPEKIGPYQIRATLQIGEPQVISTRTGVITIGDFRRKNIASGGEGAPLTPLAHFYLFNKEEKAQAVLNLGGIANLTFLPKGRSMEMVRGMDAGPGNMLIDNLMRKYFNKDFDKDGKTAFKGKAIAPVLDDVLEKVINLLRRKRSLGREDFDRIFTADFIKETEKYSEKPEDFVATVSELTARSIYQTYKLFFKSSGEIKELIICGGGAFNRYLYLRLKQLFYPAKIYLSDKLGYSPLAVEPIAFAIFAFLTWYELLGEIPASSKERLTKIQGKICLP